MSDPEQARDLAAAATVHAARDAVLSALGPLAACPLDEQASQRMRQALARAQSRAVRQALTRLSGSPPPPRLVLVVGAADPGTPPAAGEGAA